MKHRATTLGGAALAGVLLLSGSAFAQSSYYNTNPTPAERAQTNQLNSDAAVRARVDADSSATAMTAAAPTMMRNAPSMTASAPATKPTATAIAGTCSMVTPAFTISTG